MQSQKETEVERESTSAAEKTKQNPTNLYFVFLYK